MPVDITAPQAGIPETDQIKIALELILSQGGIAVMQQIYDAVEERMGDNVNLSPQGKHSLRRTINTSAVNRGYVHPYDDNNPGWRITDQGVAYITKELGRPIGKVKVTARVYVNFLLAVEEIRTLLEFYDEIRERTPREIFKKTGIILTVTAWETFIEDILEVYIDNRLQNATSPREMQSIVNSIAHRWYEAILKQQDNHPRPPDFVRWTGDRWKELIRDKLRGDLNNLNTPKSENIRDLSRKYLGQDITSSWSWVGMSVEQACSKLDDLIRLRGEVAHRTGNYFEIGSSVRHNQLVSAINFIERLAEKTEEAIDGLQ